MTKFSANLGFLWTELPLTEAIEAAAKNGFDAVECHFPFHTPPSEIAASLRKANLQMLSVNTIKGNISKGENGLCALPDRIADAHAAIDQAIHYAHATNTMKVHVMAGNASGSPAEKTFIENLQYATAKAKPLGITILIEPLNSYDAPGYFLRDTTQAAAIIETVAVDNLKLMFDCYHVQVIEGNVTRRMKDLLPIIGHIQIAAAPTRTEPDTGELNYRYVLNAIEEMGYSDPIGAEYTPLGSTEAGLAWMQTLRK